MRSTLARLLAVLLLAPSIAALQRGAPATPAGNVWIVDASGAPGATHAEIQPAVDEAEDGDLLLVRAGTYAGFLVEGKALTVLATSVGVRVEAPCGIAAEVRGLVAGQHVILRGLHLAGGTLGPPSSSSPASSFPGLVAGENLGSLWVEDCLIVGTADAAVLRDCASVVLLGCELRAADLGDQLALLGHDGGSGLAAQDARVDLHGCILQGGEGSSFEGLSAHDGGHGAVLDGGLLVASGCRFVGGRGGYSAVECGRSGDGLRLAAGAPAAWTLGTALEGGAAVAGIFCSSPAGAGTSVLAGSHGTLPGEPLSLRVDSPVGAGEPAYVTVEGTPGTRVLLVLGTSPAARFQPALGGSLLVGAPRRPLPLGVIPAAGRLEATLPLAPLRDGLAHRLQVLAIGAGGTRLGGASTLVELPPAL